MFSTKKIVSSFFIEHWLGFQRKLQYNYIFNLSDLIKGPCNIIIHASLQQAWFSKSFSIYFPKLEGNFIDKDSPILITKLLYLFIICYTHKYFFYLGSWGLFYVELKLKVFPMLLMMFSSGQSLIFSQDVWELQLIEEIVSINNGSVFISRWRDGISKWRSILREKAQQHYRPTETLRARYVIKSQFFLCGKGRRLRYSSSLSNRTITTLSCSIYKTRLENSINSFERMGLYGRYL